MQTVLFLFLFGLGLGDFHFGQHFISIYRIRQEFLLVNRLIEGVSAAFQEIGPRRCVLVSLFLFGVGGYDHTWLLRVRVHAVDLFGPHKQGLGLDVLGKAASFGPKSTATYNSTVLRPFSFSTITEALVVNIFRSLKVPETVILSRLMNWFPLNWDAMWFRLKQAVVQQPDWNARLEKRRRNGFASSLLTPLE